MDINKILNELITALLPNLNQALPKYIVSEDLDPWDDVVSGSVTLGKVDLGLCTASVKASYSIKNMVGLSSIVITSMTSETFDSTNLPTVTGTLNVSAKLTKNLSAKLSGKITAACGGLSLPSASISGTAIASGVTGTGKANFTATIALPQSCFTQVKLTSLKLNYSHIEVDISGLGEFNEFLEPLVDAINALFGNAIKGEIAEALLPVLNDLLKDELPLCIAPDGN
jgi:hypothetical protein